jgi:hypothetical protein
MYQKVMPAATSFMQPAYYTMKLRRLWERVVMHRSRHWNNVQYQGWQHGHHHHRHHSFLPGLVILGLLVWSGAIWLILKIGLIVALVAGIVALVSRHSGSWSCDGDFQGKLKNDEKAKRGDNPFYQDIEII